jgi:very-short-patch-repair endonuclease
MDDAKVPPPLAGGGPGEGAAPVTPEEAAPRGLLTRARIMRREPTPAERVLWKALRDKQLHGLKFRRQVPLGPYIVDFYCSTARLVVEVDGVVHADSTTDPARDEWLRARGLRVLRFWNDEVLKNIDGVLIVIAETTRGPLPPTPSRKGRGSPVPRHSRTTSH